MLARAYRVNVLKPNQTKQCRHSTADIFPDDFFVFFPVQLGSLQRRKDAYRNGRVRARRINSVMHAFCQPLQAGFVNAPVAQALLPAGSSFLTGLFFGFAISPGCVFVHPGGEISRQQIRKVQQVVGQIPFGINQDGWNAFECGLFQQDDPHAGLSGASHAGDDPVRGQVRRVIKDRLLRVSLFGFKIIRASKIKTGCVEVHVCSLNKRIELHSL